MAKSTSKQSSPTSSTAAGQGNQQQSAGGVGGGGNQLRQDTMHLNSGTGTGSGSAEASFASAASAGASRELPFRSEMEDFFGIDLGDVHAVFGGGAGMSQMGAAAAAAPGDTVVFADDNPSREQVAHEVAHVVQFRQNGGGGSGTTSPNDSAEQEAKGAAAALKSGGEAPDLKQAPGGIARDESGTPLERLREAANGNWIGNVDESQCLSLINSMTQDERKEVRNDSSLMRKLAGAFDETEIVQAVNALGFELSWKAYWIEIAGETSSVSAANWQTMLVSAPRGELIAYFGYTSVFKKGYPYFGVTPQMLLAADRGSSSFANLMCTYPALLEWFAVSTPGTTVIEELGGPNAAPADAGRAIDVLRTAGKWAEVRAALPTGSGLPQTTRAALKKIADNCASLTDVKDLFKIRFNHEIRASSAAEAPKDSTGAARTGDWTLEHIRGVWGVLDALPDQDVSDNTVLTAFVSISGGGGFWASPNIQIGMTNSAEYIQHTVRHEIGHSVHDGALNGAINSWLKSEQEFWYYPEGDAGSTQWINALGGFPANFKDSADGNKEKPFTDDDKKAVATMLTSYVSSGNWNPTRKNFTDAQSQHDTDLWNSMPANVRDAVTNSPGSWYTNHANWTQVGGKRFFLNYWYKRPYYIGKGYPVVGVCRDYTAMSEKEFFADSYAEYFSDPAGYSDHSKWGGNLPGNVKTFFEKNVLERQPYTPPGAGAGGGAAASPGADGNAANTAAPQAGGGG